MDQEEALGVPFRAYQSDPKGLARVSDAVAISVSERLVYP
jgi:hypothetical protein